MNLKEIDAVDIITLQDNYINITATDNNAVITRARKLINGTIGTSILAEHGYSLFLSTQQGEEKRYMLFDFGFSPFGAAHNAAVLDVPLNKVEIVALSHGHYDHFGGLEALSEKIGKPGLECVLHPSVFKAPRYIKHPSGQTSQMPLFSRDRVEKAGFSITETISPRFLLDDTVCFLGEIERTSGFEKGMPNAFCEEGGVATRDHLEDDTSIVMNLKGKGLVILSGCAHSGIINTIHHAINVTGIKKVHAVMGGFHLAGPLFEPIIEDTLDALVAIDPAFLIPCHCTGRKAMLRMEQEMPDRFILNMSGTRLTFTGEAM